MSKRNFITVFVFILGLVFAGPAAATTLNLDLRPATPGGSLQVYQLTTGNYLGLWGISGGAVDDLVITRATLLEDFGLGSSNIVDFYYNTPVAPGAWDEDPAPFTLLTNAKIAAVSATGKLYDSFWVEWTDVDLFNRNLNSHMAPVATLQGDPLAAPVPEPSTFALIGAGLAGLVLYRRRKQD